MCTHAAGSTITAQEALVSTRAVTAQEHLVRPANLSRGSLALAQSRLNENIISLITKDTK